MAGIVFWCVMGLCGLMSGLMVLDWAFRWRWTCRVFGWHRGGGTRGSDGCSMTSVCPKCGKRVLMDSQGNWFEASRQED